MSQNSLNFYNSNINVVMYHYVREKEKKYPNFRILEYNKFKSQIDYLCKNNEVQRLQTAVKEEFTTGVRFAEWLGLKNEGLMTMYGPDKTNYYRMAKIYEFHR